jgi:PD-(D/E)XK endonuclease
MLAKMRIRSEFENALNLGPILGPIVSKYCRKPEYKTQSRAKRTNHIAVVSLPKGRRSSRGENSIRRVRGHSKDRRDMAEMQFMLDAARKGFGVAKPYGDNEHYDVVVDSGGKLWRVQVKSTAATHHRGFSVRSSWRTSGRRQVAYTAEDVNFLAGRIAASGIWYVIPVRALGGRLTIHLYRFGSRKGSKRRFEKYREAWETAGAMLGGW